MTERVALVDGWLAKPFRWVREKGWHLFLHLKGDPYPYPG